MPRVVQHARVWRAGPDGFRAGESMLDLALVPEIPALAIVREHRQLVPGGQVPQQIVGPDFSAGIDREQLSRFRPQHTHVRRPAGASAVPADRPVRCRQAYSPDERVRPAGVNSLCQPRERNPSCNAGVTVIARNPWQALQAQLTTARALLEAGDREKALQAIEAALAIDPNFLAAHDLRASILSTPARAVPKRDDHVVKRAHPPLVATGSYAKFEQRVKRRRVDREVNEAQAALYDGRLREATAALAEISELDPNSPELKELTAQLDVLRRGRPPSQRGRWFAATAAVGGLVLGALYVFQAIQPMSTPAVEATSRVSLPDPIDTAAALPARTDSATEPVTAESGRPRRPG